MCDINNLNLITQITSYSYFYFSAFAPYRAFFQSGRPIFLRFRTADGRWEAVACQGWWTQQCFTNRKYPLLIPDQTAPSKQAWLPWIRLTALRVFMVWIFQQISALIVSILISKSSLAYWEWIFKGNDVLCDLVNSLEIIDHLSACFELSCFTDHHFAPELPIPSLSLS